MEKEAFNYDLIDIFIRTFFNTMDCVRRCSNEKQTRFHSSFILYFSNSPRYSRICQQVNIGRKHQCRTQIINDDVRLIGDKKCVVFLAPTDDTGPIRYKVDEHGFVQGVQGFYIDNGYCYLLSTSSNSIIKYKNSKQCSQLCFDDFGFAAVNFAVSGDHVFVVDSKMNLHVVKNDAILDTYCLYSAFLSEAIEDVYCANGKFYVCINDISTESFVTYVFALSDGKIVLERNVGAMLLEGQSYSQLTTQSTSAGSVSYVTTITNSGISISVPADGRHLGLLYLGANSSGETKVKTVELIDKDDGSYYLKEIIKVLSPDGTVSKEILIPQQHKPFVGNVKTISGTTYLLLAMEDFILVVDVDGIDELSFPTSQPIYIEHSPELQQTTTNSARFATLTRNEIISNAAIYGYSYTWNCTAANLQSLTGWTKPSYVAVGTNHSMPYCIGGFDTITSFEAGLAVGGRAGNTNGYTHLGNTYGLDCSGFVSRAWLLSIKQGTMSFHNYGNWVSLADIGKGDVITDISTHCVLYNYTNSSGNYVGYECTRANSYDRVISFSRTASSFSGHTAYAFKGLFIG